MASFLSPIKSRYLLSLSADRSSQMLMAFMSTSVVLWTFTRGNLVRDELAFFVVACLVVLVHLTEMFVYSPHEVDKRCVVVVIVVVVVVVVVGSFPPSSQ